MLVFCWNSWYNCSWIPSRRYARRSSMEKLTHMTTRQFVSSRGDTWEWEETPEFVKALQNYYKTVRSNNNAVPVPIPPNKKADA